MFAIAYDMSVAAAVQHHPRSCRHAYTDIGSTLMALGWFGPSVKDIWAFRMERGSDFTAIMKGRYVGGAAND